MTRPTSHLWRAADAVMLLLFLFAASLQLNDPDPIRWVAIYTLAAVACLLSLLRQGHWGLPAAVALVAVVWAAMLSRHVLGHIPFGDMFGGWEMKDVGVEESREMYGLLIIAVYMLVLAVRARRRRAPA